MTPAIIAGFTKVLGAPKGYNEAHPGSPCGELHVRIDSDDDLTCCYSAWQPTDEEIAAMMHGAPVILRIVGGQPPVMLMVGDLHDTVQKA